MVEKSKAVRAVHKARHAVLPYFYIYIFHIFSSPVLSHIVDPSPRPPRDGLYDILTVLDWAHAAGMIPNQKGSLNFLGRLVNVKREKLVIKISVRKQTTPPNKRI